MTDPFAAALARARQASTPPDDPFERAKRRATQQPEPSPLGLDRWRDVARGVANTAAGLLTAPGEGLARVVGEVLPENFGGRASKQAADQLKAQREAAAQAVGPYETGTGAAAQIASNLATAVVGGDPLQTAAAAATPDASTLALVGDLVRKAGGKGSVAEAAADRIAQLAESPATRAAVEYAVGRATAGIASKIAKKIRERTTIQAATRERPMVTPDAGPPGPVQTVERAPIRPDAPGLGQAPDAYQAAIARAKSAEAQAAIDARLAERAALERRAAALANGPKIQAPEVPVIRTADVPEPGVVKAGLPPRPGLRVGEEVGAVPRAVDQTRPNFNLRVSDAGRVPETTRAEDAQVLASFTRGENLDASMALRNAQAQGERQAAQAAAAARAAGNERQALQIERAAREQARQVQAAMRRPTPQRPPSNVQRGGIMGPGRANFFPGPEALAYVATKPAATAAIGAGVGALTNEDDRLQGAIIGGAAGFGAGVALRGLSQYRLLDKMRHSPSMAGASPQARAAYATLAEGIDLTGELEDGMRAKAKGPWSVRLQKIYDSAGDAARPLERLGNRAVAKGLDFELSPNAALNKALDVGSTQHRFFFDKAVDPVTGQAVGPSFRDLHAPLENNPGAIKDAWTYVVGKRIVDRGIEAFNGDAAKFQAYQDAVQHLAQNPENLAFGQRLNEYVDALGRYGVGSGLWTPTEWEAMRQADEIYVPFRDVEAKIQREMGLSGRGGGRGGSLNVAGVGKRYGNPEPNPTIANPARSLAEYTKQVIRRADQARINRSLFAAADAMGLEGEAILTTLPDNDPRILHAKQATMALEAAGMTPTEAAAQSALYVDKISGANDVIEAVDQAGRRRYAILNAPEIRGALRAMREKPYQWASPELMRVLMLPRRIVTATTTGLAPRFSLLKNPLMDVPDVVARTPGIRPADFARGYGASLRQSMYTHLQEIAPKLADALGPSQLADEASRAGLSNTSLFQRDLSPQAIADQLAPTSPGRVARGAVRSALAEPLLAAESVGAAMDMGPRLAAYSAMKRQLVAAGATVRSASQAAAAGGARAAVDYRRSSSLPALQFLYAVTPFLRASVLATQRFASFAKQYPARAATLASGAAMIGMIDWAVNGGDAEMTDRPATERAQGPEYRLPSGDVVQLPMSPELGVFRTSMYWALNKLMGDDPNTAQLVRETILRALPPGIGEFAASRDLAAFAPPVFQQVLENRANRTIFGDRPVVPGPLQRLDPAMQRFPSTAPTYDAVAAGLRKTGIAPGASPLEVENVLGSMTNGFTPAVLSLTDPIAEKLTGTSAEARVPPPSITSSLNPASAVVKRKVPARTESETEFYDLRNELGRRMNSMRKLLGDLEKATPGPAQEAKRAALKTYIEENRAWLEPDVQELPGLIGDAITELRDQETVVQDQYRAKALTRQQANEQLDAIRQRRQALLRGATAKLRERLGQ